HLEHTRPLVLDRLGREYVVERLERGEKARALLVPPLGSRLIPAPRAPRQRKAPIEQVAHVRDDLDRGVRRRPGLELGERCGRAAHGLGGAIGQRGHGMAEEFAIGHAGTVARRRGAIQSGTPMLVACEPWWGGGTLWHTHRRQRERQRERT